MDVRRVLRSLRQRKQRREVERSRLRVAFRRLLDEQIHSADHLVDFAEAEFGHQLAQLLGDEEEVAHEHFRLAPELPAERLVLRGDAHRAGVQVALARDLAADGDHRLRAEAVLLGAEQRRDRDVAPAAEAAVRPKSDALAQAVAVEHLVRLREPQLPREPRVLDGRPGRRAGAALRAGDEHVVGVAFRHARRDGAHSRLGDEFHRDGGAGIHDLQVVDQLLEVLDGVDVVVGRRRNERNAGLGAPGARDDLRHLVAGQLAAFAGLGALRHLDLQHLGHRQIFGRHPEPAGCHLLHLAAGLIAAAAFAETARILAALPAAALAPRAVERDGDRLVRLDAEGAERHRAAVEALDDFGGGLHLVERNRRAGRRDLQQVAERYGVAPLDPAQVVVVAVSAAVVGQRLVERPNALRREGVRLSVAAVAVEAEVVQLRGFPVFDRGEGGGVERERLRRDAVESDAFDRRARSREAARHDLAVESDRLEYLRALIGRHRRYAHLGHNLEQLFVDRPKVGCDGFLRADVLVVAFLDQAANRLERHIRIDRARAVADEQGELMHIPRVGDLRDQRNLQALARADQVVMHRADREQHRGGGALGVHAPVAQNDDAAARVHRPLGGGACLVNDAAQSGRALRRGEENGDGLGAQRTPGAPQRGEALVRQHRRVQAHERGVLFALLQQRSARPEVGVERHHQVLAVGVNRRVGDLSEPLAEVGVEQARLEREDGQRRVVAERADGLDAVQVERAQNQMRLFRRVGERLLEGDGRLRWGDGAGVGADAVQLNHPALQPLAVWPHRREARLDVAVPQQRLALRVDGDHLPGADAPFLDDVGVAEARRADLGGHDEEAVAGDLVARGAQPVAVERRRSDDAVGERERGGAVPWLGEAGVIFVERPQNRVHMGHILPRLRHEHRHGVQRVASRNDEQLERVVQSRRVAAPSLNDRQEVFRVVSPNGGRQLAGAHPVDVAVQRVDLAVVPQHAKGVREPPTGERVGAVALVQHRERRRVIRVVQVAVERLQLRRDQHSFVDDHAVGERRDIASGPLALHFALRDLPGEVEPARERRRVGGVGPGDEQVLDARERGERRVADDGGVYGRLAPAERRQPPVSRGFLDDPPRRARVVLREKRDADREVAVVRHRRAQPRRLRREDRGRDLRQHARAVSGLRVRRHRPAVRYVHHRLEGRVQHAPALGPVDVRDEADAARIVLVSRIVERSLGRCRVPHFSLRSRRFRRGGLRVM